jgi:hypothetical protein
MHFFAMMSANFHLNIHTLQHETTAAGAEAVAGRMR